MKIVIGCSGRKNGFLFSNDNVPINFVSNVNEFISQDRLCFHPDNLIPNKNITWRELVAQQEVRDDLLPSYKLYKTEIYNRLFQHYGDDLFIFSAGWGIVKATYKLPKYNVTFSKNNNAPIYSIRNSNDIFKDFNQLEGIDDKEKIIFFAGKDYVIPFCKLTKHLPNEKIIIFKNNDVLKNNPFVNKDNFQFINFKTKTRTNWHYEFANNIINNEIKL